MAEIEKLTVLNIPPGISRDGTTLDKTACIDGNWVRFQRGKPKKIGGYARNTSLLHGPVRGSKVWSRGQLNNVFAFSSKHIEVVSLDNNGGGGSVTRVTPSGFVGDPDFLWSVDTMYDSAAGSEASVVLAVPIKTIVNIDDSTEYPLYIGPSDGSDIFEEVVDSNAVASGGVFVSPPYSVLYGTDGKVTWSNANEPRNYTTGDAGTTRVSGSKIVKGMSIRSGSGPAGLMWTLDSVVRMDYIGGPAIFRFTKIGESSILAQNSVVEYDGVFYWIGVDRFMACSGSEIAELPNNMNSNWFFDNLNYAQRQKIWATVITRYGEIWWFYPRGDAEECTHAVIFNVREKTWYDVQLARSSGHYSQMFRYPVMFGEDTVGNRSVSLTIDTGTTRVGDTITGGTSGASGTIVSITTSTEIAVELLTDADFVEGETLTTIIDTHTLVEKAPLYSMFIHEKGVNAVIGDDEFAIDSYFTTNNIAISSNNGINRLTRLDRIEPDLLISGPMELAVSTSKYANSDIEVSARFDIDENTSKIDTRVQGRNMWLTFSSNVVNGYYELGRTILLIEAGDVR